MTVRYICDVCHKEFDDRNDVIHGSRTDICYDCAKVRIWDYCDKIKGHFHPGTDKADKENTLMILEQIIRGLGIDIKTTIL